MAKHKSVHCCPLVMLNNPPSSDQKHSHTVQLMHFVSAGRLTYCGCWTSVGGACTLPWSGCSCASNCSGASNRSLTYKQNNNNAALATKTCLFCRVVVVDRIPGGSSHGFGPATAVPVAVVVLVEPAPALSQGLGGRAASMQKSGGSDSTVCDDVPIGKTASIVSPDIHHRRLLQLSNQQVTPKLRCFSTGRGKDSCRNELLRLCHRCRDQDVLLKQACHADTVLPNKSRYCVGSHVLCLSFSTEAPSRAVA